jgi:hypothetical protein
LATLLRCVHHYQPPTAQDPHAVFKLRRSVGEDQAFVGHEPAAIAKTARTDAILVHPTPAQFRIDASFTIRKYDT